MTVYDIAAALPSIEVLRGRCRAIAVLERAMDGIQPYHCYTRAWGDDEAALMRDGCGDEWAVVFTGEGAFIRVFDHESAMSPYCDEDRELWPGLLDGLPPEFVAQVEEPAFGDEEGHFVATAVLWRLAGDDRWHAGQGIEFPPSRGPYDEGPDGTYLLEILLDDIVDKYLRYVEEFYETSVDRNAAEHVVAGRPLTDAVIKVLNPNVDLARLREDVTAMGYPLA
ncbi:hypothetical protein GCM10009682_40200 [Luedemannella flava]|uniref:Uncharacterized protein n=1 Tax=Luedemannella flava TaxID=349316 RepID=A0ABP4YL59_9ACTN